MKEITSTLTAYRAHTMVEGQEYIAVTTNEEEFNEWLKKGKAPVHVVEGHGLWSSSKKVWRKIRKAEKQVVQTVVETTPIEF